MVYCTDILGTLVGLWVASPFLLVLLGSLLLFDTLPFHEKPEWERNGSQYHSQHKCSRDGVVYSIESAVERGCIVSKHRLQLHAQVWSTAVPVDNTGERRAKRLDELLLDDALSNRNGQRNA